jgi:polyribonucleotide nucleotidyltransferase
MLRTISAPRHELSLKAPRVIMKQIPVDKIGEVIGPKGKRINEIIAVTGADIDIEDDGRVFIGSREGEGAERAVEMIEAIVNPRMPQVGERYDGTVVKTTSFGAFVNILPGRDGMIHISKLGRGKRLSSVEEAINVGDHLLVEIDSIETDNMGRTKVSLKPVGEGWDPPEGGWPREEGDGGPRGERRPRSEGERRDRGRGFRPRRDRDRGDRGERRGDRRDS